MTTDYETKTLDETLTIGETYMVKDSPFQQVATRFTGAYQGHTDGVASFITETGAKVMFMAEDLSVAIEHGEITIISPDEAQGRTAQFNTRLPAWTHDLIDLMVETTGMTKTQILIAALESYAEKIKKDEGIS